MADTNNSSGNQKSSLSWSQPSVPGSNQKQNTANGSSLANTGTKAPAVAVATSNAGMYIGIFVVGLIIGALIGWGISASHSNNTSSTSTTASSTNTTTGSSTVTANNTGTTSATSGIDVSSSAIGSKPSVTAADNVTVASTQPAGFDVAVQRLSVSQPTWLVVYEDHNGVPGNAIGAGLFFNGQQSGTIELLRATLPGQKYFVGQSLDDGDKIFSLQNDKPVRDSQGNPLFTQFTAQ